MAAREGAILDAGVGVGLMGEFCALLGCHPIEALELPDDRYAATTAAGARAPLARTAAFASLPLAEPEFRHRVFVYMTAP